MRYASVGLFAIAMTSACAWEGQYCEGDWAAAPDEPAPPMSQSRTVAEVLPTESTAVDILFVIDDSMSMMDEQEQLGVWSKELFDVLSGSGELPDLHIAVTSSSVAIPALEQCATGTGGTLHVGGATLTQGRFIRDIAGETARIKNYSGTLQETFAKLARVGATGCGFEQPFKAARLALATQGFLREDALLLVVFVTDEDDCSSINTALYSDVYADACTPLGAITSYRCFEHGVRCYDGKGSRAFGERRNCRPDDDSRYIERVSEVATFLRGLKNNPAQVIVAGIYGKPNHIATVRDERVEEFATPRLVDVCGTGGKEGSGATPAVRMNALMAQFGGRASQSSICETELSWAMRRMGLVTRGAATRSHCLHGALVDVDIATRGTQPTCRVQIVNDAGTPLETRTDVPPCDGTESGRCFTIESDATCATETQLAFRVAEASSSIPGTRVNESLRVNCDVDLGAAELTPSIGETFEIE